ncbi:YbaB/EbfC family nucleoid-associated protein [Planomonospora sp. ID82291]|uniref:YbaB/EbfC family nucleoid-associated protein n=1 Tax=Planomonospora sp. ID82291 TaxID=2738136 RepID=UPI0018C37485|nr:YbaB/EbfC family nucleoid-associated protein [Planomonospora sp. ID82291]MBG0815343.1 YbaB/EbfC family nucleoid-associated protein [Planomonospora sp. ID82291]
MDERELLDLVERLPEALAGMEAAVEGWSAGRFRGTADEGRVVATVDAVGSLLDLEIHVLSKRRLDGASLGEAVVAAVAAAEEAAARAKDEMMDGLRLGGLPSLGELLGGARRDFERRSGFSA